MERAKARVVHRWQAACISDGGKKNTEKVRLKRLDLGWRSRYLLQQTQNQLEDAVIGNVLLWQVMMCVGVVVVGGWLTASRCK